MHFVYLVRDHRFLDWSTIFVSDYLFGSNGRVLKRERLHRTANSYWYDHDSSFDRFKGESTFGKIRRKHLPFSGPRTNKPHSINSPFRYGQGLIRSRA